MFAKKNSKRVGTSTKVNESGESTFTLMLSGELFSNSLLPPFIIFKAVFGANIMKTWENHKPSRVVTTQTHFQNEFTFCLWLQYVQLPTIVNDW